MSAGTLRPAQALLQMTGAGKTASSPSHRAVLVESAIGG